MGIEFYFCKMKSSAVCCTTTWIYLTLLNCTLKNGECGKFCVMCYLSQFKMWVHWVENKETEWEGERINQLIGRNGMSPFSLLQTPALWPTWIWWRHHRCLLGTITAGGSCTFPRGYSTSGAHLGPLLGPKWLKAPHVFSPSFTYTGTKALNGWV